MDQYFNGVSKSFTCKDDENLEAVELLDEYWFFENLLHRKTRMFRSASDPYPSTKTIPDMVFDTQDVKHSSTTTSPSKEDSSAVRHSLVRTPSLPPSIGRGVTEFSDTSINKEEVQVEVDHFRTSTPIIGRAEKDVISDGRSSRKLHRQASLSSSKVMPPLRALRESSDPSMSMKSMAETFFETQVGKQTSSSTPTNPSIEIAAEVDSTSPSSGSRDQEKEVIIRRSPRNLARQGSVSSSKAMPSQRVTTDSLDPYLSSKSMEETFFETQNANQVSPFTNTMKEDTIARHNLLRAPSLPPLRGRDDKDCIRRSSNKMTRQASLCSSDALPPLRVPKSLIHSPGIPRHRAARRDLKAENMTNDREVIRRSLSFKRTISSPKDLEVEEVQGFKDLGFVFNKEDLNKRLVDIIPGLQDKNPVEEQEDNKARRPYLSEAWLVQPPTPPPFPNWVERKTAGDMKSHLKYWARSVASNMRQEC